MSPKEEKQMLHKSSLLLFIDEHFDVEIIESSSLLRNNGEDKFVIDFTVHVDVSKIEDELDREVISRLVKLVF